MRIAQIKTIIITGAPKMQCTAVSGCSVNHDAHAIGNQLPPVRSRSVTKGRCTLDV